MWINNLSLRLNIPDAFWYELRHRDLPRQLGNVEGPQNARGKSKDRVLGKISTSAYSAGSQRVSAYNLIRSDLLPKPKT